MFNFSCGHQGVLKSIPGVKILEYTFSLIHFDTAAPLPPLHIDIMYYVAHTPSHLRTPTATGCPPEYLLSNMGPRTVSEQSREASGQSPCGQGDITS